MAFTEAWQGLERAVGNWISHPSEKPFNDRVKAEPGEGIIAVGQDFVPEASYFSVRLVEMNLAEGGRYFTEFLPLGVCLSEYTIGAERQRKPMILSNDTIADQLKGSGAKPGFVEYKNMYAVRRAPVKADNLSLFVGLFRMPYNDLAKEVLQIAADVTDQIGGGVAVSQGIKVAERVYDRIAGLFKLNVLTPRLGFIDGNALTTSGYLVVAGPASPRLSADSLRVIGNRLHQVGPNGTAPAQGFDYCLVALEHTATLFAQGPGQINPLVNLPFHKRWRTVTQLLAQKKVGEADAEMPQLRSEVIVSPDLTEDDRLIAITAYDTAYEKHLAVLVKPAAGVASRGARSGDPVTGLRKAASAMDGGQSPIRLVLDKMADRLNLDEAPPDPNSSDDLFLREATFLRKALVTGEATKPNVAAQVAAAISGAVNR